MPKMPDNLFITGCDEKTEWQLPWFLENYFKHNNTPIAIGNFGMSDEMVRWCETKSHAFCLMHHDQIGQYEKAWFLKPAAMLKAPGKKVVWLDTDCQVMSNLDHIFRILVPNKLNMVMDRPWLKRRKEEWFNSGVVGFIGKPEILHKWAKQVEDTPNVGDQEVLHSMLDPLNRQIYIHELPNKWNWLRLQIEHDNEDSNDKKIMHWTGAKGNDRIKGLMKIKETIRA